MKLTDTPKDARPAFGKASSYWMESAESAFTAPLQQHLETEVVIIGGGLAGLSVAYCLTQSGRSVVLVEDGALGSGETGRTTAQLVTALDDRYYHFNQTFGEEKTRLIADSHALAIDFVEQTILKEHIDCGFERLPGYLLRHPTDQEDALVKELSAALSAGVKIDALGETPGLLHEQTCLRFREQAQFHPLKYLQGLRKAIEAQGGQIYTGTHAAEIDEKGITTTEGFTVKAKHVVVATNSPVNNLFAMSEKQYAYRSYVIGALVPKDLLPRALWWDTGDLEANATVPPYHYVRLQPYNEEYDLLISGGEDHPTGDTNKTEVAEEDRYQLVEQWTRLHFPIGEVVYRWSGQVLEPMDGLAFIGRNPLDKDNVYIVTGDSGNGMTHCSFAGLPITDLINGKENKWEKLYSPSRFTLSESGQILAKLVTQSLYMLNQMPNFNGTDELATIANGEGRTVNMLEEQFGAYRNTDGLLHIVSAKCTHLQCTTAWNADQRSWDCPCHGSRFTYEGKVINGPANSDLPAYTYNALENTLTKR